MRRISGDGGGDSAALRGRTMGRSPPEFAAAKRTRAFQGSLPTGVRRPDESVRGKMLRRSPERPTIRIVLRSDVHDHAKERDSGIPQQRVNSDNAASGVRQDPIFETASA
ncbi:hypothetical protein GCM10028864_29100 [Microlunatus parietis]